MTQPPTGPEQPDQPEQGQTPPDPYGAPPPPPPSYGSPSGDPSSPPPPQYGAPPPAPPSPAGAPGNPYAAPSGYPAHSFTGEQPPAGKGMAIGALVSAFLCCLPIGLVLGIIVLRRSKDGRDHGKGLAIAAIVVNVLVMLVALAVVIFTIVLGSQVRAVSDLEPGDCVSGSGMLTDDPDVGAITEQECTEAHDGEVMGVATLTSEDIEADEDDFTTLCFEVVSEDPDRLAVFDSGDYDLLALREGREVGDTVACLALDAGGDRLTEPLVD